MIAPYSSPPLAPVHLIGCKECSLIGNTAFKLLPTELTPPKIWSERIGPLWGRASNKPTLASLTTNCLTCLACYLPLACFAYFVFSTRTWTLRCSQKIEPNMAQSQTRKQITHDTSAGIVLQTNAVKAYSCTTNSDYQNPTRGRLFWEWSKSVPHLTSLLWKIPCNLFFFFSRIFEIPCNLFFKKIRSKFFQRVARSGSICKIWVPNAY